MSLTRIWCPPLPTVTLNQVSCLTSDRSIVPLPIWLVFSVVNLCEPGCRIADTQHYSAKKSDYEGIRTKARHDLDQYWEMVAEAIGDGPYLLGQRYSVVDICLLMIAQWHPEPAALVERYPNLGKLYDAVKNRPAIETIWNLNFP